METAALQLKIGRLTSVEELNGVADAWDDLWRRSEVRSPRSRASLLALWIETFAGGGDFQALTVEADGELVAAIPLLLQSYKGIVKMGTVASNLIAAGGDLLLDPQCNAGEALHLLAAGLSKLPVAFLRFDGIPVEEHRWKGLLAAMEANGQLIDVSDQYRVGRVSIDRQWEDYEAGLSRNHRRNRRRQAKLLEQCGGARLHVISRICAAELTSLLRRGFEVEDRSWKGVEGSSVLKSPGMFEFFCREGVALAERGELELAFLELGEKPMAFLYGWNSKAMRFAPKVGYDEAFERFGPGQQLMMRYIQYLHQEQRPLKLDFHGPLMPWTQSWATESYPLGRIVATTHHPLSRSLFRLNFKVKPLVKSRGRGGV